MGSCTRKSQSDYGVLLWSTLTWIVACNITLPSDCSCWLLNKRIAHTRIACWPSLLKSTRSQQPSSVVVARLELALRGLHLPGNGREPDVAQSTWRKRCGEEVRWGEEGCGEEGWEEEGRGDWEQDSPQREVFKKPSELTACSRSPCFGGWGKSLPTQRNERPTHPTHLRVMSLLSMAVVPEERSVFRERFKTASADGCCKFFCQTPIGVIAKAFGCKRFWLRLAANMFPGSGLQSEFLNDFYIMDVILNRAPSPAVVLTGDIKQIFISYLIPDFILAPLDAPLSMYFGQ